MVLIGIKILSRYLQPKATISYLKNMKKFQLNRFITTINRLKNMNFPSKNFNLQKIDATNAKIAIEKALAALNTGIDELCFSIQII